MANINIYGTLVRPVETDKIVQGSQVDGGYFVCETLPTTGTWSTGQLCYCQKDSKIYQYNGTTWAEKEFGTKTEATASAAGLMSKDDKKKLDNISAGAEVNVQADWNETNNSSDAYIKNKPSIINNLESDSTTDALSAAMGKALQMTIDSITTDLEDKGAGDMLKAVYATGNANNTNMVDKALNAEQLGGVTASSYAKKSDIPNITVSQEEPKQGSVGDIWFKY